LQKASAKLPWSHNIVLIEQLIGMEERFWCGYKTIENGWSVAVLKHQIAIIWVGTYFYVNKLICGGGLQFVVYNKA